MARKQSGFTMIELLITFVVLGALAGIAIPAFSSWIPNYRLRAAAMDIYSNLQKAKMEAIRRNAVVIVRFNQAGGTYEVFVDDSEDATRNAGEQLLSQVTLPDGISYQAVSFSSGVPAPGFTARGLPFNSRIGNVEIKNVKNRHFKVILSIAGNLRMETSSDGGATWE